MARSRPINLPAPYLRRVWLEPEAVPRRDRYPFALPAFRDGFELSFERPITIVVGENGTGTSTLLEAIATLIGFDEAGGGSAIVRSIMRSRSRRPAASSRSP